MTPQQFIAQHAIFTAAEFAAALDDRAPASLDSILAYHHRAGHLFRLRRGLYARVKPGTTPKQTPVDPFVLATKLAPDSVLAYHTALAFHRNLFAGHHYFQYLTVTAPRAFRFRSNVFRPVRFPKALHARGKTLWGVQETRRGGITFSLTSVERTFVDVLDRLDLGGTLEGTWRSVEFFEGLDVDRVVEYALLLRSATTAAKVGFFLSQHRGRLKVKEFHLLTLCKHRPLSPHYIQPRQRLSGTAAVFVRDWNIIVPKSLHRPPEITHGRHGSV